MRALQGGWQDLILEAPLDLEQDTKALHHSLKRRVVNNVAHL